jgi:predicted HNH restriction endonuclease
MLQEFHDDDGSVHHNEFQGWRRANPSAFFLTFYTKQKANLHGANCQHLGSYSWRALKDGRNSLTRERKVYSDSERRLAKWAARESVDVHVCRHCLRDGLVNGTYIEATSSPETAKVLKALEGAVQEYSALSRGRSAALRKAALTAAKGRCECCRVDFSRLLGGRGVAVLEVHHRKQLSHNSTPVVTSLADLAVLCANCHALVHSRRERPMAVGMLRRQLSRR